MFLWDFPAVWEIHGGCQEILMFLCHRSWDLETMFKVFMGLQAQKHGKPKVLTQYVDSLI